MSIVLSTILITTLQATTIHYYFNGDVLDATGHIDPKMRKVYKRKLEVEATR